MIENSRRSECERSWMLYQLAGDEEAATVFVSENAEILHNNNWQDVEKNQ